MSRLKQNIFATEEPGTEHEKHPAYLLVDQMIDGKIRVIVRERGHGGDKGAEMYITREQLNNLSSGAVRFLRTGVAE